MQKKKCNKCKKIQLLAKNKNAKNAKKNASCILHWQPLAAIGGHWRPLSLLVPGGGKLKEGIVNEIVCEGNNGNKLYASLLLGMLNH